MTTSIVFFTSNNGKFREINYEICKHTQNYSLLMKNIDIPEIQDTSNENVIKDKLNFIKQKMLNNEIEKHNFIVEDTGLYINNMNGFPGALIKYYLDHLRCEGIAKLNGGSKAIAETWIGYWDSNTNTEYYYKGCINGMIAKNVRGLNGFGYDAIFIPDIINEYDYQNFKYEPIKNIDNKTYAEFTDDEKNKCNMRTIACYKFITSII